MKEKKVPPNCPLAKMMENHGKAKEGFSCELCLINPSFCFSYRQGEPGALLLHDHLLKGYQFGQNSDLGGNDD